MRTSTNKLNQAIERMTTGAKINHAKDNAANYSINTEMTTKMNAYMVAEDNAAMGLDMVTTMSDTLELLNDHASRIRDLCEQASNGTYGEESLKAIQSEIDARLAEIERIKANAEYNGIKLFEGEEIDLSDGKGVTGSFIANVDQLTPDEAIAQGYTIIRTADELQAMEDYLSGKYILMNDIDLEGYDWEPVGGNNGYFFSGELNGNGYVIKNLTINKPAEYYVGLFGFSSPSLSCNITNLGLENVDITGSNYVGGILGGSPGAIVNNCYVTGKIIATSGWAGGITGEADCMDITNSYVSVSVTGDTDSDGLTACASPRLYTNCYYNSETTSLSSNYATAKTTSELNALIITPTTTGGNLDISLQVGINSDTNSQIKMSLKSLKALESINATTSNSARSALSTLDDYINSIGKLQTNLGSVSNRLESVLEEILIQHDNLVSSRSTIRDADIAEVSSQYIQQQILQQASATLLASTQNIQAQNVLGLIQSLRK